MCVESQTDTTDEGKDATCALEGSGTRVREEGHHLG